MKEKIKIFGPMVVLALLFYMMLSTPHSRALGDIVLESIGLKSWTDGNKGTHLTIIYFVILCLVILVLTSKFLAVEANKYKKHKFFVFISTVFIIYFVHSAFVHNRMENSEGLHSIAIAPSGNSYELNITDGNVEQFKLEFELTNYSKEAKLFSIDSVNENMNRFELYNKQGEIAYFYINGNETHNYRINHDNYILKVKGFDERQNLGSRGVINSLLLLDDNGNRIKIVKLKDIQ